MKVRVKLFAAARDAVGTEEVLVDLPEAARVNELRDALKRAHPQLSLLLCHALFAINSEYAHDDTLVPSIGEIACIPPVSGG